MEREMGFGGWVEPEPPGTETPSILRSVTYGAFGLTINGYSADDVLRIREAYLKEKEKKQ
jgi:hypothetical protein